MINFAVGFGVSSVERQSISIENVVRKQNIVRRTSTLYKNIYLLTEKENLW